jgi:hypothetical protein
MYFDKYSILKRKHRPTVDKGCDISLCTLSCERRDIPVIVKEAM